MGIDWKEHPEFKGYFANKYGDIYSSKSNKILRQRSTKRGYKEIKISQAGVTKTYLAHRLIAECFFGKLDPAETIDHINFVKDDNRIENLRVLSAKDNHSAALHRVKRGFSHYATKISEDDLEVIKTLSENGWPQLAIAEKFECNQSTISRILRRSYV